MYISSLRYSAPRIGIGLLAVVLAVVPLPPSAVEQLFSNGVYPFVQSCLTGLSNLLPFAFFDALALAVIGWWVWRLGRDLSNRERPGWHGWANVFISCVSRTLTTAAALYVVFLLTWGLNYRRAPLPDRLLIDDERLTVDAAQELVLLAVQELNALHQEAHALTGREMAVDPALREAFARAQRALAIPKGARPARPKRTLLDIYFTSAGVAGMTDPYFLETFVASNLLPIERPFVIAHEWSHLAGFADEGEANFLGWLTSVRGSALAQYSGWLFLYSETLAGLPRSVRTDAANRLEAGPREDLRAISERIRRHVRPRIANAGWQVYDRYLKANRVESGAASYGEVVRLVLSARFDAQWNPVLK